MLEKNKDYLEMRISSTDCAFTQNAPTQISVDGHVYTPYMDLPNPGEFYILISKEKFEQMQAEIEHYKRDITSLQSRVVANAELARQREINYDFVLKTTGFDTVAELVDYLDYEGGCDTLHEAIDNLDATVKSYRDMFDDCEPDYVKRRVDEMKDTIISYTGQVSEWREATGCPSPSAAKTLIESGASWHHAYNEIKKANEKLADDVKSWQKATGYSTSEALLSAVCNDPDNVWRDATGCDSPQEAGCKINRLCDDICKLKGDYDRLLKLTGYKSEDGIRVALNYSEQFVYETMRELINSLKRKAKFTESNWQEVTGFSTPEKCSSYIDRLEKKLEDIKNLTEED